MRPSSIFLSYLRLGLCIVPVFPAAVPACAGASTTVSRRVALMGTWAHLEIRAGDPAAAEAAAEAAIRELEAGEAQLSTWTTGSDLARLNATPAGVRVTLAPRLAHELRLVVDWWRRTGGAFNPAMGPLVRAWDLRGSGRTPSPAELRSAVEASDPKKLDLRTDVAIRRNAMLALEEGAWGKGAALDRARTAALEAGAREVLINLGGQVLSTVPFEVEVVHPADPERVVARWRVPAGSVATSGNGERADPHILDPRTGRPAPDFGSVSVWAPSALDADVLATALFVMGPVEGPRWVHQHPDIRSLWTTTRDGDPEVYEIPPRDDILAAPAPRFSGPDAPNPRHHGETP